MTERRKNPAKTAAGASKKVVRASGKDVRGAAKKTGRGAAKRQVEKKASSDVSPGEILVAFEKLFGGGRGVGRFARTNLRFVRLAGGALLVEQNPKKKSEWAELARAGQRVAWVMLDGRYFARVLDGEVVLLGEAGV